MKKCLTSGLLFLSLAVFAQKETVLKSIDDNGKTLKLAITVSSLNLNFSNSYDVANLSSAQKKALIDRVVDSLGVTKYFIPKDSHADHKKADKELVAAAVRDYVEALYEADTSKIERSVAKQLAKRGYYTNNGVLQEATMTYDQLISLTKRWKNSQNINESTPKKITVLDVLDQTASAKLEAKWGIDYFHLAKVNGKWMIMNVLWQEYPKSTN